MKSMIDTINALNCGAYDKQLKYIYSATDDNLDFYRNRYLEVIELFKETYGDAEDIALFSAPGRTEIGGNHTDHQHGCVLAGSVNLDVIAAARPNGTNTVRIQSKNYNMDIIDLDDLEIHEEQFDKAISLIRGIIKKFVDRGVKVGGFDAYTTSNVLKGSGLSSSAAFEVLVGTVINGLFANGGVSPVEIAQMGQFAENVYFNKPSGLMDQMASSVGSVVAIDFMDTDKPVVNKVEFDLAKHNHALCIIDSGADHADLTDEYATIPADMKEISNFFGKDYLRQVDKGEFFENIKNIRDKIHNDRAILRAIHFFSDNQTAQDEVMALKNDDFDKFLELIKQSGRSSYMYLQNIYASSMPKQQAVALVLALCDKLLGDRGAYRVHGGGFAGTVQAFVPFDMLDDFKSSIEAVVGKDMCHILSIRPVGGYELK
ncbi:MAG: galactokinase [Clostridia bacterium]|nr:galactokinase [Clostridia bacterium]